MVIQEAHIATAIPITTTLEVHIILLTAIPITTILEARTATVTQITTTLEVRTIIQTTIPTTTILEAITATVTQTTTTLEVHTITLATALEAHTTVELAHQEAQITLVDHQEVVMVEERVAVLDQVEALEVDNWYTNLTTY